MKLSSAWLCLLVAVVDHHVTAATKLNRRRSANGEVDNVSKHAPPRAKVDHDDEGALWDRILQDAAMSVMPEPTPLPRPPTTKAPTPAPPTPAPPTTSPPTDAPPTTSPPTDAPPTTGPPTDAPPTTGPPTDPPTPAPVTPAPVVDPTAPPTDPPTTAPVPDPTPPPTEFPTASPSALPTTPPVPDPTPPPTEAPTTAPVPDPTPPPTDAPTTAPVPDPTPPPTDAPTTAPVPDPTPPPTEAPTTAPVPDPTPPPTEAPTLAPVPDPTAPPTDAPTTAAPTATPTPPPVAGRDMRAILTPVALQGGAEFDNPDNYQAKALAWLEGNAYSQDAAAVPDSQIIQRYALASIYYATFGVQTIYTVVTPRGWIDSTNWLEGDECAGWFGITCNANGGVERIVLASNRITGTFPPETTLMKDSVTRIDLFRNSVYNSGDEGNAWLGEMTNIRELFYGQTNFEYNGIPPQISQLTNLVEYDCSFTLYFGPLVGSTFAPLTNLEYLVLSGNSYNNSVPVEIGQLPNLQFLYVQNAFVDGGLDFMQPMTQIVECWVDQNPGLGGRIPTFMGTLQTLQSWSITRCGFTGAIPTELGNLRNMVRMWMYDNMLTGQVPSELGNLFKLQTLELEENLLTGTMPEDICLNRAPLGLLTTLEADCGGNPPEIQCDCCTCCENCLPSLGRTGLEGGPEHTDDL